MYISRKFQHLNDKKKKLEKEVKEYNETNKEGIAKYDVKAIEFDWIFDELKGKRFLTDISSCGDEDIFEVDTIKRVILYLWKFYRRAILWKIFLPFIIYFTSFIIFATWVNKEKDEENDRYGKYSWINYFLSIFILAGIALF